MAFKLPDLPYAFDALEPHIDALTMESEILGGQRKYALYLPPDYNTSQRDYPVLYLLHGGGDDQTGWVQFGEVLRIADQGIKDGSATPMIISESVPPRLKHLKLAAGIELLFGPVKSE